MSDWAIVEKYVNEHIGNYKPDTSIDNIVEVILLSWMGENEDNHSDWSLSDYLHDVVGNDIQSYDYD